MQSTDNAYHDFFIILARDPRGADALTSLDIIDTKAGGLAGLIGGFSAAAFFVYDAIYSGAIYSGAFWLTALIVLALVAFSISGILCASCLNLISHFDYKVFRGLETFNEEGRTLEAAKRIILIYRARTQRYLFSLYTLYGGVVFLTAAAVGHVLSRASLLGD